MLSKKRKAYIGGMKAAMYISTGITAALVIFLVAYVFIKGIPNISWELLSTKPSYISGRIGILPDILNTLYIVLATLIFVIPLGVGAAIYLTEYAKNKKLVGMIEYAAETLSGIPSIIYGLVGMLFFCQFLGFKTSLLAGSLTLVIMNLPTVMRTTQESLKTVPQSYRDGAFGLGAGKLRTVFRIILPSAMPGILSGVVLAAGRIAGETAALIFTAGTTAKVPENLFSSTRTLAVHMYCLLNEGLFMDDAYATAVVLVVFVLAMNGLSKLLASRLSNKKANA